MIEKKVRELIENVITENNYILDEVQYVKEGSSYFLRIIVDKENAYINIEDCLKINALIGPIIDNIDIEGSYILDVCSKEKGSL